MRWFIGDVHGCAHELETMLERIRFTPDRDELWFTGDLVNRGPDSLAALRIWRDTGGRAVLGNHDLYAVRAFRGERAREADDTLDELFAAPDAAELIDAVAALPVMACLGGELCLVHAAVHPAWHDLHARAAAFPALRTGGPPDPDTEFALTARCCTRSGARVKHTGPPGECPEGSRPWDDFYGGHHTVVHGHWASRGHYRNGNVLGLDSGCVYGGGLTAWNADEDRTEWVKSRG